MYEVPAAGARDMWFVDLERPHRQLRKDMATIKVCEKTVWAVRADGRRHLVGSSAFQTEAAAQRCRVALLRRIVNDPGARYYAPYALIAARDALNKVLH